MNAQVETTETLETKKEKVVRNFTLEDGSVVDFGARANFLSSLNTEDNSITFKFASGQIIVWKPFEKDHYTFSITIEGQETPFIGNASILPENFRLRLLQADMRKVKDNVASVSLWEKEDIKDEAGNVIGQKDVPALYEAVVSNIENLDKGKYAVRGLNGDSDLELTLDQQAYANFVINYFEGKYGDPKLLATKLSHQSDLTWTHENINDPEIIADIQKAWNSKDRKNRNSWKRNGMFMAELSALTSEKEVDETVLA